MVCCLDQKQILNWWFVWTTPNCSSLFMTYFCFSLGQRWVLWRDCKKGGIQILLACKQNPSLGSHESWAVPPCAGNPGFENLSECAEAALGLSSSITVVCSQESWSLWNQSSKTTGPGYLKMHLFLLCSMSYSHKRGPLTQKVVTKLNLFSTVKALVE